MNDSEYQHKSLFEYIVHCLYQHWYRIRHNKCVDGQIIISESFSSVTEPSAGDCEARIILIIVAL